MGPLASRRATASAPELLNPMRFSSARSLGRRKSRGCGLPACGSAVTVPTSTKPKPSAPSALNRRASLSKPAASPTGFRKRIPQRRTSSAGSRTSNAARRAARCAGSAAAAPERGGAKVVRGFRRDAKQQRAQQAVRRHETGCGSGPKGAKK